MNTALTVLPTASLTEDIAVIRTTSPPFSEGRKSTRRQQERECTGTYMNKDKETIDMFEIHRRVRELASWPRIHREMQGGPIPLPNTLEQAILPEQDIIIVPRNGNDR